MGLFEATAVLVGLAALFGYLNYRYLALPATTGILGLSLLSSLFMLATDHLFPDHHIRAALGAFLSNIDLNQALLNGMLCFLLFAGALHVRFEDMRANRWTIVALATLGVILSTFFMGGFAYFLFGLFGLEVPLPVCLVLGALLSPTDPIAVMGLLKELKAPKDLDAMIAAESLFNDGVGVVLFLALAALAGLGEGGSGAMDSLGVAFLFLREIVGGVLLGFLLGYLAYRALKSIDHHPLELLITLALAMSTYALAFRIGVSGPIAVVVAGLMIGNWGRQDAMSTRTQEHVDGFWGMMDDILNAILFLLIGLLGIDPRLETRALWAAVALIPASLAARYLSVLLPVTVLQWGKRPKGLVPILTWGGLKGGLSIAMVLSLPLVPEKGILLTGTYAVVLFSVLVQGLTMRRLLDHFGIRRG